MTSSELYIFDLDETLLNGDSSTLWNQYLVKQGIVNDPLFLQEDTRLMTLYSQGKLDMQQYLDFVIEPISMIKARQIQQHVQQFIHSEISHRIFPQAKQLVKQLQQQGKEILIISASVDFLVANIAKHLTINHHLAIELHRNNDCYTSQIKGIPSYQNGKVLRLQAWLETQQVSFQDIYFYTDSINDLSLCNHVDHPRVVNPCPQLTIEAQQRNWPQLSWG